MCGGPYLFTPLLPDGTNLSRIMSFQLLPLKALCSLRHSGQLPWLLVGPQLWESHQQRPEGRKLGPDPTPPALPASFAERCPRPGDPEKSSGFHSSFFRRDRISH